ncbi:hypothetical protein KY284_002561 [Solanum tuberosum]|nr:hypothetical protein KY284_002561 [Solanum tuberosum]
MQEVFPKVIAVCDAFPVAAESIRRLLIRFAGVYWFDSPEVIGSICRSSLVRFARGRYLTDFAGVLLEQERLSSIAIRGRFVRGASPEKMVSGQWC